MSLEKQQKKELLQTYKGRRQVGCVYAIRNTATGGCLLGSAANCQSVYNRFGFQIGTGTCPHPSLAADWDTYGAAAFKLEILEELEKEESQTVREFREDIKTLEELWREKM